MTCYRINAGDSSSRILGFQSINPGLTGCQRKVSDPDMAGDATSSVSFDSRQAMIRAMKMMSRSGATEMSGPAGPQNRQAPIAAITRSDGEITSVH